MGSAASHAIIECGQQPGSAVSHASCAACPQAAPREPSLQAAWQMHYIAVDGRKHVDGAASPARHMMQCFECRTHAGSAASHANCAARITMPSSAASSLTALRAMQAVQHASQCHRVRLAPRQRREPFKLHGKCITVPPTAKHVDSVASYVSCAAYTVQCHVARLAPRQRREPCQLRGTYGNAMECRTRADSAASAASCAAMYYIAIDCRKHVDGAASIAGIWCNAIECRTHAGSVASHASCSARIAL